MSALLWVWGRLRLTAWPSALDLLQMLPISTLALPSVLHACPSLSSEGLAFAR